jgi:hypothetical protein
MTGSPAARQAAYFMDGPNGENTISGGFTAGCS